MRTIRRLLSALLVSLGLLFASLAIFVHLTQISLLQTGRLQSQAPTLLQNQAVQSAIADSITASLNEILPQGYYVPTASLDQAVASFSKDPTVIQKFSSAMGQAQARLLGQSTKPIVIGGPQISSIVASAIAPYSQEAATAIANNGLALTIPGARLPNISWYAKHASTILAITRDLALLFLAIALVISPSRKKVIRHISFWLIGMSFVGGFIFWFAPTYVLPSLDTSWSNFTAALLDLGGAQMVRFFALLFGSGVAGYIVSRLLPSI